MIPNPIIDRGQPSRDSGIFLIRGSPYGERSARHAKQIHKISNQLRWCTAFFNKNFKPRSKI